MYLATAEYSVADGANVVIMDDPNRHESHWEIQAVKDGIYTIRNMGNGEYLHAAGHGSNVTVWDNVQTKGWNHNDVWDIKPVRDDIYIVKSLNGDMYVNVLGGWVDVGTNLHMWDNWYSNHSEWHISKVQA